MMITAMPTRILLSAGLALSLALPASAQPLARNTPDELQGIGIDQKLDQKIPLNLTFADENGRRVKLDDYFEDGRPVILTLNYFRCDMLCDLTLNGLVDALKQIDWTAGEEFEIVTVSFAPEEGPELADVKKRVYLLEYGREPAEEGWHFLTGEPNAIGALTDATGFRYRKDEKTGEYAHTSTILFVTPDGRISKYMNDVAFAPKDVRYALVDASKGAIGSPLDKFLLFNCYRYDPDANSYVPSAWKIMRLGGVLTLLTIGLGLFFLWRQSARHGRGSDHDHPIDPGPMNS
jgi:protein SCO1/2